jgi:hypothetical protein
LVIPLLFIFSTCFNTTAEPSEQTIKDTTTEEMLQHTVFFYLNSEVTSEQKEQFESGLEKILEISVINKAELGIPAATEERDIADHDFAYAIYTWFETMEEYKVYAKHPDHLDFIDEYNHLWADVKVYDSDITGKKD